MSKENEQTNENTQEVGAPVERCVIRPLLELTELIQNSAFRLNRLVELKGPKLAIENERRLLLRRVLDIPVDTETQLRAQYQEILLKQEEQDFLIEHGFYDEQDDGHKLDV